MIFLKSDFTYNVIIPLVSAFIGGFISLWLFKKGIEKQKQAEKEKRIQNNFETEEYFKINLESILIFIDHQINEISFVSKKTKNWNAKNLTLAIMSELKTTELRELDFKTLFQIFVIDREGKTSEKSNDFINIKNCLNNIEDFAIKQQSDNSEIHKKLNAEGDSWNNGLKNLMQYYNKYALIPSKDKDEVMDILYKYLIIKQKELIKEKKSKYLNIMYSEVIFPLGKEISLLKIHNDIRIHEIIGEFLTCRKAFESIQRLRYERRRNVLISGRRLLQIKRLLRESLNSIIVRKKRIE
jgi:hypothetical protein